MIPYELLHVNLHGNKHFTSHVTISMYKTPIKRFRGWQGRARRRSGGDQVPFRDEEPPVWGLGTFLLYKLI